MYIFLTSCGDCTDLQMIERIMKRSNSSTKYLHELNFLVHLLQSLLLGVLIVHIIFKHSGVSWFEALGDHLISFYQLEHQFYRQFVYKASLFLHAVFKSWLYAYFYFHLNFNEGKYFMLSNFLVRSLQYLKKLKKTPSKVAKKYPNWFLPYCPQLPKWPKQKN